MHPIVAVLALALSGVMLLAQTPAVGAVSLIGVTSNHYNGSMVAIYHDKNGYDDARQACIAEFPNTHVCTAHEMAIVAQVESLNIFKFGKGVRYVDLSTSASTSTQANDCWGFTSAQASDLSVCLKHIVGGPVLPTLCGCDERHSLACCAD
ncbi:hypothetical protein QOT17_002578 [Balamuthia mandrillaris]